MNGQGQFPSNNSQPMMMQNNMCVTPIQSYDQIGCFRTYPIYQIPIGQSNQSQLYTSNPNNYEYMVYAVGQKNRQPTEIYQHYYDGKQMPPPKKSLSSTNNKAKNIKSTKGKTSQRKAQPKIQKQQQQQQINIPSQKVFSLRLFDLDANHPICYDIIGKGGLPSIEFSSCT